MSPQRARPTHESVQSPFGRPAVAARLQLCVQREAGKAQSRTVVLDGELFRIGSHESNDLVLDDPQVSRFHCRLVHDRHAWRVLDSGSLNGTRVGGLRLRDADLPASECKLEIGDSVVHITELPAERPVELLAQPNFGDLVGDSLPMHRLFAVLDRIAQTDVNVLIDGESGTGKELVATEIVRRGPRARKPFVIVDCSMIAPHLIESELFGHVKGALPGATRDRTGAFEAAQGGTVFLDEIGDLPLDLQPKLLRALEMREIRRVGESEPRSVDVRVVAATNRRLEREVNNGRFREDLYFLLSAVTIRVPRLRERLEDIELLVRAFLESMCAQSSAHLFTGDVLAEMMRHDWPGNVRELRNFVERTVMLQSTSAAREESAQTPRSRPPPSRRSAGVPMAENVEVQFKVAKDRVIAEFERRYVTKLLEWADGNISRAARKAGMDRMNLYRLIQRYGLRDPRSLRD